MSEEQGHDLMQNDPSVTALVGFDSATFFISVDLEKFQFADFARAADLIEDFRDSGLLTFAPTNGVSGHYHALLSWHTYKNELRFRIEYDHGGQSHSDTERPPFAEGLMAWLGQFFSFSTAHAHLHVQLKFPLARRRSAFPLPLKTHIAGGSEIDGISVALTQKPEGIERVRLWMGKKSWFVEVIANRRVEFKTFELSSEFDTFSATLQGLLEDQ